MTQCLPGASWEWPCPLPWESVGGTAFPTVVRVEEGDHHPPCPLLPGKSSQRLSALTKGSLCPVYPLPCLLPPLRCGCQISGGRTGGWHMLGGLPLGLRGQHVVSWTPFPSVGSIGRKSATGTRLDTYGVASEQNASSLPSAFPGGLSQEGLQSYGSVSPWRSPGDSGCLVCAVGVCACGLTFTWVSSPQNPGGFSAMAAGL